MKITGISTIPIAIPIFRTHKIASFTLNAGYFVLVRIQTDEGLVGYGEASLSMGPVFPEETWQGAASLVNDYLGQHLIGKNPFEIEAIMRELDQLATRNYTTKFAIETALYDLIGKALNRPAYDLLGGASRSEIPLSWSLASGDPKQEVEEATEWVAGGHRIFKIKFGFLEPQQDIERLKAIRKAVGDEVDLRIDVNQGWTPEVAIPAIRQIEDLGLRPTFVEQPVAGWDLKGLARITRSVDTPIMADEGLYTLQDAQAIIELEAADIFAIKVMKHGGFLRSKQIAALAEAANIPCYVGSNLETGIATLACLHFAVSTPWVTYGCELFGPRMLVADVLAEPVEYGPGLILCPSRPGIGAVIDEDKVEEFRIR